MTTVILSDTTIERRIRRMLARCGLRLKKSRAKTDYCYTVVDALGEHGEPMNLRNLIKTVEHLDERRRRSLVY